MIFLETFLNNLETFTLDEFNFKSGAKLENVQVEFLTGGTPKYDEEGNITNAIVYCHGANGNYTSVKKLADLINPGEPFDKNEYFFICATALGTPNSCSPSTTELYNKFPEFCIEDLVNFQRELLKNKFKIKKLKGIIGNSMGGYVVLTWAALYPDEMDFIIPIVTSYKTGGHHYIVTKFINELIESDPSYEDRHDINSLYRSLRLAIQVGYSYGLSRKYLRERSKYELDVFLDNFGDDGLFNDVYDVRFNNDAILNYDIEELLGNIKAKTLVVGVNQDEYFDPKLDSIPLCEKIDNSTLILFDSDLGHVGTSELYKIRDDFKNFMETV